MTTINELSIGDIFRLTTGIERYIKTTIEPVKECKKILFYVRPEKGVIPKAIRNKTEVIFIRKSKNIVI